MILFEINWARGEAYNDSVDRAADDSKKDTGHDESYSHSQSESENNETEDNILELCRSDEKRDPFRQYTYTKDVASGSLSEEKDNTSIFSTR